MATETRGEASAYDGRLFELYTKYVSEPESKKDVYGYGLLVVGYLLAIGGLFVFLVGPTGSGVEPSTRFLFTEIAAVPSAAGLVLSLLGIVLLMPVRRGSLVLAVLGALAGLAAIALFVTYYPDNWFQGTPSYSDMIIALYTAGIAVVAGVVLMVPVVTGERSYLSETTQGPRYEHPDIMIGEADRGGLFALFKRGTEWTWRFVDQAAVATSTTGFLSRLEAEERVETVKEQVASAGLLEITNAAFRLYESAEGRWQWYLVREDGAAVAEGASDYGSRDAADEAINAIKDHGPDASLFVMDEAVYDIYRRDGGWGWRLADREGTSLAVGEETYTERDGAAAGLEEFRDRSREATDLVIDAYGVELVSADDAWGWRLRDSAHRQLATGLVDFESKGVAEDAVYDLLDRLQHATTVEAGVPTYDVYRSGDEWAWRLVDDGGEAVARGRETADAPGSVSAAASTVREHLGDADVVWIEDMEFETYRTGEGWAWRLVDADRNLHAESTEVYGSEDEAERVVSRVREEAPEADLIEFDNAAFQVYESEGGAWRWRLIDEDGAVLADSGQGEYESKGDATSAMVTLQENAPDAEHLEIENAAFELFQDDDGWGWRLVDDIGDTIADGATRHETEEGARQAMDALVETVADVDGRRMATGIFQVYADSDEEWWWQFVLPDGSVVADAPRSFATRHEVEDAVADVGDLGAEAPVATVGRLAVRLDPADWSWDLVDADREAVAESTVTYDDREAAVAAVEDLQAEATETTVYEIRDAAYDCYRSDEGWTWRLIDADHEPIARAPGTFADLSAVESAIETVGCVAGDADLVDFDDVAFQLSPAEGGWTWRLVDEDGSALATAASVATDREAAERDVEAAREEIADASVIEIDSAAFEFHHTDEGWRWRLVDERGGELAESLAAFESRAAAQEELATIKEFGPDAWTSVAE